MPFFRLAWTEVNYALTFDSYLRKWTPHNARVKKQVYLHQKASQSFVPSDLSKKDKMEFSSQFRNKFAQYDIAILT